MFGTTDNPLRVGEGERQLGLQGTGSSQEWKAGQAWGWGAAGEGFASVWLPESEEANARTGLEL